MQSVLSYHPVSVQIMDAGLIRLQIARLRPRQMMGVCREWDAILAARATETSGAMTDREAAFISRVITEHVAVEPRQIAIETADGIRDVVAGGDLVSLFGAQAAMLRDVAWLVRIENQYSESQKRAVREASSTEPGKDVVFVPTDDRLVETMLTVAGVTAADHVIDLGSGDGRLVVAAALRGATAVGWELAESRLQVARARAEAAQVADRATFMSADFFTADLSPATVVTLFLLPELNLRLRPQLLALTPGTRIVSNTFEMGDWAADETVTLDASVGTWRTAHLWVVPAVVAGHWRMETGTDLVFTQTFQRVRGRLGDTIVSDGRVRGTQISFSAGGDRYEGVMGSAEMSGTVPRPWRATPQHKDL